MKLPQIFNLNKFHELFFYLFLISLPFQLRTLFNPQQAYIDWYFNYHLGNFLYLSDLFLILCLFSWLFFEKHSRETLKTLYLLGFFVALITLTVVFHGKQLALGVYGAGKLTLLLFLVVYLWGTFSLKMLQVSAWIIFGSGILQGIMAITQFHVQHMLGLTWLGEYIATLGTPGLATINTISGKVIRAYGTMPHPNVLGGFLVFSLAFGLYVSRETYSRWRYLCFTGVLFVLFGLFFTFSRTSWLGGAVLLATFGGYWIYKRDLRNFAAITVACLFLLGSVLIVYRETWTARGIPAANSASVTDRKLFNTLAIEEIKTSPILGTGAGNYISVLVGKYILEPWQYQPPHNIFLFIAGELGLVALAVFIFFVTKILFHAKHFILTDEGILLVSLTVIVILMGQFDHYFVTIQQGRLVLFTLLGTLAALPKLYERTD